MNASVEKNSKKKSLSYYFRLMCEARKTNSLGKIFSAFDTIEKFSHSHQLIPSKDHLAGSLYISPTFVESKIFGALNWGSIVIHRKAIEIEEYLNFKHAIEKHVLNSDWVKCSEIIAKFENKNGVSAVTKELAIAITQQHEGTAKQITFSRKLEAQCSKNAAILIRLASERNEDRLTLSGYKRKFKDNFESASIPDLAKAVISWHGLHQLPKDEDTLFQLLGFEESGSIYDYYEIYVASAIQIASSSSMDKRLVLKNCLTRLAGLTDQRIINIRNVLNESFTVTDSALTINNVLNEIKIRSKNYDTQSSIENSIVSFFNDINSSAENRRYIHKLSANFFHLDYFQVIFSHLEHKSSSSCLDQSVSSSLVSLSSKTSLRCLFGFPYNINQLYCKKYSIIKNNSQRKEFLEIISDEFTDSLIYRAIKHAQNADINKLNEIIESYKFNNIDRSQLQLIAIGACFKSKKYLEILPLALEISDIRLDSLTLVPVVTALENILPGRLSGHDAALYSIVTSRILLIEDSDRLEDKLMVATEVAYANKKIIPEWSIDDRKKLYLWIRFLKDVLIVQNMLLIDGVNSLRDALNLRVEVLRRLEEIDPDNRTKYHEEVRDIAFSISVDEGVKKVNTSRLNVNIQGLTKWANEHCIDDYERYKELVIGEANVGDISIKQLSNSGSILEQVAVVPFGAADDQLLKLLIKIRNAYLSDPRNGLDAYISLRVRHGSLSGTLSRGLDTRQLLLLRKGESGPFEPPEFWIERLALDDNQISEVTSAFSVFTDKFRKLIDDLLKNRLHVKNEKNSHGEITIEITDLFIKGIKLDIIGGIQFDAFISSIFIYYKYTVSTYLESLRAYLKSDFQENTIEALEELSEKIGLIVNNSSKTSYINDAITNARLDLQSSIRIVCGWLEIAQKEDLAQVYTVSQATEIGIYYTKQVRNKFVPQIDYYGLDENLGLTGASLVVIADILFILLDNVYTHAGSPNERKISLHFDLSEKGLIKMKMKNDLADHVDKSNVHKRFDAARKLINCGESEKKLTEENQSGFPKLSRLVVQDRTDALTFGLTQEGAEVNVMVGYTSLESES